jgi:hypothetical protein
MSVGILLQVIANHMHRKGVIARTQKEADDEKAILFQLEEKCIELWRTGISDTHSQELVDVCDNLKAFQKFLPNVEHIANYCKKKPETTRRSTFHDLYYNSKDK